MAWLSDLAGRAENMLNKLDQNTASALGSPGQNSEKPTAVVVVPLSENLPEPKFKATADGSATNTTLDSGGSSPGRAPPSVDRMPARKLDDFVVSAIEREIEENSETRGLTLEQELAATKILLAEIKAERNELKSEVSQLLNQIHSSANNNRQKILEQELNELKETNEVLVEANGNMSTNQERHTKRISELEVMVSKLNQNIGELQEAVNTAQQDAIRSGEELNNYRTRAQTSLQLKERIIEELRTSNPDNEKDSIDQISNLEFEQIKHENQDLIAERDTLVMKLESHQSYAGKLEEKYKALEVETGVKLTKLSEDLAKTEIQRKNLQQENSMLNAEIRAVRTQSNEQNQNLVQQLYEKEQELASLRRKSPPSKLDSSGYDDNLDNRIKSLTQSLIQKQTTLEEVTAQRNATRIQLEKTESQYRSLSQQFRRDRQTEDEPLHMHSMTDDDKAQLPLFMQDNPFDNQMAKRMKRVIRASDSLGASLGAFLRRYPLLRIVFLIYTVFLHIWVMVVLVSSTPN